MPAEWELVLRLVVAAALGGAIGLERELSDQPAGFRTHILVSLGSCLFAVLSAYGFGAFTGGGVSEATRFDPSRVAAQIVSGIGFLGAGAIIRYGVTIRGLTTAASLWVVAAIGMGSALGAYLMAAVTTVITLVSLFGLRAVRSRLVRGLRKEHQELMVETDQDVRLDAVVSALGDAGIRIDHLRTDDEEGLRQITLYVEIPPETRAEDAVARISRLPGVRQVDWSR